MDHTIRIASPADCLQNAFDPIDEIGRRKVTNGRVEIEMQDDEKLCPECAETVKKAAKVCKHCGHKLAKAAAYDGPQTETEKQVAKYSRIGCAVVVVGLIAMVATCDFPDPSERGEPASGNSEDAAADGPIDRSTQLRLVGMAKDGVRARLRDPDSADFRNVGFYSGGNTGGGAVCGEVNSRNGFGGYTGFDRFVAAGEMAFFESDTSDGRFGPDVWDQLCVKAETDEVQLP